MSVLTTDVPIVRGLPGLGNAPRLLRDPLGFVGSLRAYGPVATTRIGSLTLLVVNDPGLIRQLHVDKAYAFDKGRQYEKLRVFLGDGLASSEGATHLRQRRLMQPAFHRQQVARYVQAMQQAAEQRVSAWPAGQVIQLDKEFYALLVTMVTQNLFSTSIDEESIATLQAALRAVLDWIGWLCLDTTDLLAKLPVPANRRFRRALQAVRTTVEDIIDNHRADRADLLTMLQAARDQDTGEAMSRQQVYDEAIVIMTAGSETTATTLSWACHLLSQHPGVQRDLQTEVDSVLAGRPPQATDLDQLACTRRVITETLRLYPPVWLLTRRATVDVELGPYLVPAGSAVCYSAYAVHRDPSLYPDPDRFDPDRWLPGRQDTPSRAAYIPFGAGKRGCIGEPVAWAQAAVTLATIAQRWTLHPAPGARIKPMARMLLTPNRLPMVLQPRHTA
jgi:cytochrome P450